MGQKDTNGLDVYECGCLCEKTERTGNPDQKKVLVEIRKRKEEQEGMASMPGLRAVWLSRRYPSRAPRARFPLLRHRRTKIEILTADTGLRLSLAGGLNDRR